MPAPRRDGGHHRRERGREARIEPDSLEVGLDGRPPPPPPLPHSANLGGHRERLPPPPPHDPPDTGQQTALQQAQRLSVIPEYRGARPLDLEQGYFTADTEGVLGFFRRNPIWSGFSAVYGQALVAMALIFSLTEVMDNNIELMHYQRWFFLYLYGMGIIAIALMYIFTVLERCPCKNADGDGYPRDGDSADSRENLTKHYDQDFGSLYSWDTLKRAYIRRSQTTGTRFYLRVGGSLFGLISIINLGLEVAAHSTLPQPCVDELVFVHPILQAIFTFLQMHFLFVNSQEILRNFASVACLGYMHLAATNVSVWIRIVVWSSAEGAWEGLNPILRRMDDVEAGFLFIYPRNETEVMMRSMALPEPSNWMGLDLNSTFGSRSKLSNFYQCLRGSTLGQQWIDSLKYLQPFTLQFCMVSSAIFYLMWCNIRNVPEPMGGHRPSPPAALRNDPQRTRRIRKHAWKFSNKGVFLGMLMSVCAIVLLVIFFVMKSEPEYHARLPSIGLGAISIILGVNIVFAILGLIQAQSLSYKRDRTKTVDSVVTYVTSMAIFLHGIMSMIAASVDLNNSTFTLVFFHNCFLVVQVALQSTFINDMAHRCCRTNQQYKSQPGKDVVVTMLFSNLTLWLMDMFVTYLPLCQTVQLEFYGALAWGVFSHLTIPLMMLHRIHATMMLLEISYKAYLLK